MPDPRDSRSGVWLRLRQYAADHRWPRRLRVWMARPHAYSFARGFWRWPRRHALGYALAPVFGRSYQRWVASRVPEELIPEKPVGGFYG